MSQFSKKEDPDLGQMMSYMRIPMTELLSLGLGRYLTFHFSLHLICFIKTDFAGFSFPPDTLLLVINPT